MRALEQFLFWVHGMSAAAWFGAIFYRTLVVDGKAHTFFDKRADYEHFSTHLAHNMRYFVTAGLLTCGLSGFALVGLKWDGSNIAWLALVTTKVGVWLAACGLFTYVSWVHGRGGRVRRRTSSPATAHRASGSRSEWWHSPVPGSRSARRAGRFRG